MSSTKVMKQIAGRFEISEREAWRVISDARKLIAATADKERPQIRAMETVRLERIAMKAEEQADQAARMGTVGSLLAAVSAHRAVIAASREIGRLNGAYAPEQVEVAQGPSMDLAYQLDRIFEVLDEAGRAAFRVVAEQLERARLDGRLALPQPDKEPDIDDEVVDMDPGKAN
jgi:hypothetical protein